MGTVTVETAIQSLYDLLGKTEYKQYACWSTVKTFVPVYEKINREFISDLSMNNKHEFIPTPIEEIGTRTRDRT